MPLSNTTPLFTACWQRADIVENESGFTVSLRESRKTYRLVSGAKPQRCPRLPTRSESFSQFTTQSPALYRCSLADHSDTKTEAYDVVRVCGRVRSCAGHGEPGDTGKGARLPLFVYPRAGCSSLTRTWGRGGGYASESLRVSEESRENRKSLP